MIRKTVILWEVSSIININDQYGQQSITCIFKKLNIYTEGKIREKCFFSLNKGMTRNTILVKLCIK